MLGAEARAQPEGPLGTRLGVVDCAETGKAPTRIMLVGTLYPGGDTDSGLRPLFFLMQAQAISGTIVLGSASQGPACSWPCPCWAVLLLWLLPAAGPPRGECCQRG